MGRLRETTLPNGVTSSYEYDSHGRLDVQTDTDDSGNTLAKYDYDTKANGKRTRLREQIWQDADGDGIQQSSELGETVYNWDYDELGRLIEESIDHFDPTISQTETYEYDLTGNRTKLTRDKGNDAVIDEVLTYFYDANDRLELEFLDSDGDGTADRSTAYGYDQTQQTSKTVSSATAPISKQTFAYNLQGRLRSVVNEQFDSGGVVTSRSRSSYDYDSKSYRVEITNEIDADLDGTFSLESRVEFLADHQNFTSYTQTIRETTFDAAGNETKRIDYTFGADEISQTVTEDGQSATHVFGHDGHGSVRVLYDLAGVIEQTFTFSAYGAMIAVHSGVGVLVGTSEAAALTSLGYSGEHFDAKVQQQYLRARFYDPSNGRFNRLDPFFGNLDDPQSFHKYAYVHGDPIQGIDPTGKFLGGGLAGTLGSLAVQGFTRGIQLGAVGAVVGGGIAGVDAALAGDDVFEASIHGAKWGAAIGFSLGFAGPFATTFLSSAVLSTLSTLGAGGSLFLGGLGATDSFSNDNYLQGTFRLSLGVFGAYSLRSAATRPARPVNIGGEGEVPGAINLQGRWALSKGFGRSQPTPAGEPQGASLAKMINEGHDFLIYNARTQKLPFKSNSVPEIHTNNIPITSAAPGTTPVNPLNSPVSRVEIERVLAPGGKWFIEGVLEFQKPL